MLHTVGARGEAAAAAAAAHEGTGGLESGARAEAPEDGLGDADAAAACRAQLGCVNGEDAALEPLAAESRRAAPGKPMPKDRRRSPREVAPGETAALPRERRSARRPAVARQFADPSPERAQEGALGCVPQGCVPQVTLTPEGGGGSQEIPEEEWAKAQTPLSRKLSSSSVSSTGSSATHDESEDDVLSDTENRSKGIVTLEAAEDPVTHKPWSKIKNIVHWPFVVSQRKRLSWIQLAGHKGSFKAGEEGTILKKLSENEKVCFERLRGDPLEPFVPRFHGVMERDGEAFLQLSDLLTNFDGPSVMDCKMGVRKLGRVQ